MAERMYNGHSIRGRQNDSSAAEGDTLRIDMLQYPVNNWWCDAEQYLQLLLARSLPTSTYSWTDPRRFRSRGSATETLGP
jgi:hypothetical protein